MKKYIFAAVLAVAALTACDKLDGDSRFTANGDGQTSGTDTLLPVKRMLVEDYTGQFCVNCPPAADLLHELEEETYGERMVIVGMHAGGLAIGSPLYNDTAQTYMTAINLKNNPGISIDRQYSNDLGTGTWAGEIAKRAASMQNAPCEISTLHSYDSSNRTLSLISEVDFHADYADSLGIQHYIVEDSIVGLQLMPPPEPANMQYVHNHVFRSPINTVWGHTLQTKDGEKAEGVFYKKGQSYFDSAKDVKIAENWNEKNLRIVSFVFLYSGDENNPIKEIVQVNQFKLLW